MIYALPRYPEYEPPASTDELPRELRHLQKPQPIKVPLRPATRSQDRGQGLMNNEEREGKEKQEGQEKQD